MDDELITNLRGIRARHECEDKTVGTNLSRYVTEIELELHADRAALLAFIDEYAKHKAGCDHRRDYRKCDCGLTAALAAINEGRGDG